MDTSTLPGNTSSATFDVSGTTHETDHGMRNIAIRERRHRATTIAFHTDNVGCTGDRSACGRCDTGVMTKTCEPALVPELLVVDVDRSLTFWRDVCGFEIRHSRPEERFAYIALGSAELMLEQIGVGRNWITGPLEAPLGRGINFQINVPNTAPLVSALANAGIDLLMQPETKWYRIGNEEAGVEQFLVADPDGYLIRFQSSRGRRPVPR